MSKMTSFITETEELDDSVMDEDRGDVVTEPLPAGMVDPTPVAADPEPEPEPDPDPDPDPDPVVAVEEEPFAPVAEDDPDPVDPDPIMIPKSRFDDVLAKNRKLQADLSQAQEAPPAVAPAAAPMQTPIDIGDSYTNMREAILNGDDAAGQAAMTNLLQATATSLKQEMTGTIQESSNATIETMQYEASYGGHKAAYPMLDENAPQFDADITESVRELRDGFMLQNYQPRDALDKAVSMVMKPILMQQQLDGGLKDPLPNPLPTPKKGGKQKIVGTDVNEKLIKQQQQAPDLSGTGNPAEEAVDLENMSQEEFDALPSATQSRLRGDFV